MISEQTIQDAVRRLAEAAKPCKIILFGSYARGDAREHSDLDFLVVENEVKDHHQEMLRLSDTLRPLHVPADVLVVDQQTFDDLIGEHGSVIARAQQEGIVCYDSQNPSLNRSALPKPLAPKTIPAEFVQAAVNRLVAVAHPRKILLFGPYARGDARAQSALNFLVVEREVKNQNAEMVRLDDALRPLQLPVEVLVVSESKFNEWADMPGTVIYHANHEGQVCYDEDTARARERVAA